MDLVRVEMPHLQFNESVLFVGFDDGKGTLYVPLPSKSLTIRPVALKPDGVALVQGKIYVTYPISIPSSVTLNVTERRTGYRNPLKYLITLTITKRHLYLSSP